jgi:leucyl-tRNA synthetase
MAEKYIPQELEPKWQQKWEADQLYRAVIDNSERKFYYLTMLPYPSGALHIGHYYAMCPSDAQARYYRMNGYNVMFPIGFDAFGLPAENAAIEHGTHPKEWTYANIDRMRAQLRSMGAMWDWGREAISSDPAYYKWTQWFFLQFYKRGLAYKAESPVDFCPQCNTTLAREQVWGEDRHCERCGTPVIKKDLEQWFFRITDYAEELLDHSRIEWPERVVTMQKNWIGRSEGADAVFKSEAGDDIVVFTTRPDTLWGATFMVLAPEHPLVEALTTPDRRAEVEAYVTQAARRSEIERTATDKEKTGVFIGAYAINPVNGERIPIWIADYVLMTYGTGAIMAVPAHDERDFEFAEKFDLPIPVVIAPPDWDGGPLTEAYVGEGKMVNSGSFDGTPTAGGEAVSKVIAWLEEKGIGEGKVRFRLHDWLISRQRYWGAPIPIVYCSECGTVPLPEDQLPVLLPDDVEFMPTGESPLKFHEGFLHTACPTCGGPATRETDTMDTFMCSSWYHYRYLSPDYNEGPWDPEEGRYWLPVDQYTGGIEHATMHLMYTRFFTKALRDMGLVDFDEPMLRLYNQGMVLGEDGEKMSKSRGNVIAPDDLVRTYGADTVRTYLMFFARWDQGGPWDSQGIKGPRRFLEDVWNLVAQRREETGERKEASEDEVRALRRKTHQTIRKVTEDLGSFSFNTAIAALMELRNTLQEAKASALYEGEAWHEALEALLLLLCPIAPHITEELWARLGKPYSIHQQEWLTWNEGVAAEEMLTLIVQVNGKLRDRIEVPVGITEDRARELALTSEKAQRHIGDKEPRKVIYVPGKLVNVVV